MSVFSPRGTVVILLVGALVAVGSLQLGRPSSHAKADAMSFWEAAGRGLVTATVVNETYFRNGETLTSPVGVRLDNAVETPVTVSEEAVMMSPHPLQTPAPDPHRTTPDAITTRETGPSPDSATYPD